MKERRPLTGKTALITGASSGIGAATAVLLAAQGADVIVHYNSKKADAESVRDQVTAHGVGCELLQAELSSMEGVTALCDIVREMPIDILVNNAGSLVQRTKTLDFTLEIWERVLMLNYTSAFFLTQAVLPGMLSQKSGVVVNVSSIAARTSGNVGAMAYAAAKAAVSVMTKGLAKEFAGQGIRSNAVSPGTIDTPYHQAFSTEEGLNAVRAATPLGRLGTSEEVAEVIAFLCSDASAYIQGQVLEINGGFFMA